MNFSKNAFFAVLFLLSSFAVPILACKWTTAARDTEPTVMSCIWGYYNGLGVTVMESAHANV